MNTAKIVKILICGIIIAGGCYFSRTIQANANGLTISTNYAWGMRSGDILHINSRNIQEFRVLSGHWGSASGIYTTYTCVMSVDNSKGITLFRYNSSKRVHSLVQSIESALSGGTPFTTRFFPHIVICYGGIVGLLLVLGNARIRTANKRRE